MAKDNFNPFRDMNEISIGGFYSGGPQFNSITEIMALTRYFFALLVLKEHPEGISIKKMQNTYGFTSIQLEQILEGLKNEGNIVIKERDIEGKSEQMISITEIGKKYFGKLMRIMITQFTAGPMIIQQPGGIIDPFVDDQGSDLHHLNDKSGSKREKIVRVIEAEKRDIGHSIVRLDIETTNELGISSGGIVEIIGKGKNSTVAIARSSYPQDQVKGTIRIDGRLRNNIGSEIDDTVIIRKAEPVDAKLVVLTPHQNKIKTNIRFESFVHRKLISYPVIKGDLIWIHIGIDREISFKVISLKPENTICIVKASTQLQIKSNSGKSPDVENDIGLGKEFSHEESPQLDEIKSLKEKIISLENRMDQMLGKIEELILKISELGDKKKDSNKNFDD